jgi:hypothetical protein
MPSRTFSASILALTVSLSIAIAALCLALAGAVISAQPLTGIKTIANRKYTILSIIYWQETAG